jgi:hypothetical protein
MAEFPQRAQARLLLARARRVATWVSGEAGDTMIEVVVAAMIVALIAAATFVGFGAVAHVAGAQRHQVQANELAQQDEERLRGLSVTELAAIEPAGSTSLASAQLFGNSSYQETVDSEVYTIASVAKFVSASSGGLSCTTGGSGTADYVETSSTVTWGANNDGRQPVVENSLLSPPSGGGLITSATNANGAALPGATISVEGPGSSTNTQTLTTDANGCAVFAGLVGGTYTVTASDTGYETDTGVTNPSQSVILVAGATQTLQAFQLGQSWIQATFLTAINGAALTPINWDSFSIDNTNYTQSYGTVGTFTSPVSSSSLYPATYSADAGTCSADDPGGSTGTTGLTGQTGATYTDPTVGTTAGATGSVAVIVPTMLLKPTTSYTPALSTTYNDDYNSSNPANDTNDSQLSYSSGGVSLTYAGGWKYSGPNGSAGAYGSDETDSTATGATLTVTFIGTSISWLTTEASANGTAAISMDGVNSSSNPYNDSASTTKYEQTLYTSASLTYGTHTLKITANSGSPISIEGFTVGNTGGSTTGAVTGSPLPYTVTTYDSCPTTPVGGYNRTVPAPVTSLTVSSSTVYPVQAPYGTSVQVCFANTATNTNTGPLPSASPQISNTNLDGTTVTSLTLPVTSGATGASAVFNTAGACQT